LWTTDQQAVEAFYRFPGFSQPMTAISIEIRRVFALLRDFARFYERVEARLRCCIWLANRRISARARLIKAQNSQL
jgi:hypothetical protein